MAGRNSAYSPLPQSNSDSEGSSEELQISQDDGSVGRILKAQNVTTERIFNGRKPNIVNYKPLNNDGDIGATLIRFQPTSDEVSILSPNNKVWVFSTSRKMCFVLSLLLCIFTTVAFIWILPCNKGTCFSVQFKETYLNWVYTLDGLEMYGPIGVFFDVSKNSKNLVFLTKEPLGFNSISAHMNRKTEVIVISGQHGVKKWNISLHEEVTDLDCSMIDINLDGQIDCLIFGNGFMKVIDSNSGIEYWDLNESNHKKLTFNFDFPLAMYDVDSDGVNDLLMSCSSFNGNSHLNFLVVISGKSGVIINNPLNISMCSEVHNLAFESNTIISYTCYNLTGKESVETINLDSILKTLTVKQSGKINYNNSIFLHHHTSETSSVKINGMRLKVENSGHCPENCSVYVDLRDEENGLLNKTVYSNSNRSMYCIGPVIGKSDKPNSLVLKFWNWQPNIEGSDVLHKTVSDSVPRATFSSFEKKRNTAKTLESFILDGSPLEKPRFKRAINRGIEFTSGSIFYLIKETIISVNLTKGHHSVRPITDDKFMQICKRKRLCVPEVHEQRRSLLITDINGDGREELISFSSRYTHQGNKNQVKKNDWLIKSFIKVMTL
ncbi:hypothetical protein RUM43_001823 [Polyplax serrata]|uniref:FAM234A/B beta-propeller domain-containing protein n=1 Tax=Polyplax serrata TaxID=468196 RepID=A0AAN8SGT0_POLSC